jgi:hypothetical protein
MAVTKTRLRDGYNVEGKFASQIVDVTFDSSYSAGGESILPSEVGLKKIYGAVILGVKDTTSAGYHIVWDYDSNKLIAMIGDSDGVADGPFVEASGNLTTVTVRVKFFGLGG